MLSTSHQCFDPWTYKDPPDARSSRCSDGQPIYRLMQGLLGDTVLTSEWTDNITVVNVSTVDATSFT
jgi:hypothetical protein